MAFGDSFRRTRRRFKRWLKGTASPTVAIDQRTTPRGGRISAASLSELAMMGTRARDAFERPKLPYWVEEVERGGATGLAMDSVPWDDMQQYALSSSPWSEGLGFLGYAYLAELTQRPEYRRISEIWAAECTRKWIKLTGGTPEKLEALEKAMLHFGVREKFREAIEIDGFMGRAHIYMDFGDKGGDLELPVKHTPETIPKDSLKNLKVIEAFWAYPLNYNTNSPISDAFYAPQHWQIYSDRIDNSRMLTFVGRELPDMLKPVYMFGGLSLSQMVKPYVDNYIRNRTSIGNLLFSFSTMVLATEMGVMLTDEGAGELTSRIAAYVFGRDNGGLMLVDKETEELTNVSAPLGTTDALLAQSLEQILIPAGIPMVIYAGTTPHGLNASSDGEITAFHGHIQGYNEKTCNGPLSTLLAVLQLNEFGEIDESIKHEWLPLSEPTGLELAEERAKQAEMDCEYMDRGVLSGEEVRNRLTNEEGGPYEGIKLEGDDDAAPGNAATGLIDKEEGQAAGARAAANDAAPRAAAVLVTTQDGQMLLTRRAPHVTDHPGKWAFPGGAVEDGEDDQTAAWREFYEETGVQLAGLTTWPVIYDSDDGVRIFHHVVGNPFEPKLCSEHTAHRWVGVQDKLPGNMHPNARAAIRAYRGQA